MALALAGKEEGLLCTIVEVDMSSSNSSSFSYRVCSICERTLPPDSSDDNNNNNNFCSICNNRGGGGGGGGGGSKRLYRLLVSVATADRVRAVVLFDRAARVLMGCSADQLFDLCRAHPSAADAAADALRGEMCRMTLSEPPAKRAEHLRVVSVVPLRTGFSPAAHALDRIYHFRLHHHSAATSTSRSRSSSSLPPTN